MKTAQTRPQPSLKSFGVSISRVSRTALGKPVWLAAVYTLWLALALLLWCLLVLVLM